MRLLHILRSDDLDDAWAVITAQAQAGVDLNVVLEGDWEVPVTDVPVVVLNGRSDLEQAIDWDGLVGLIFSADTVITW